MSKESLELLQSVGNLVWASGFKESDLISEMKDASVVVSGLRQITRKAIFASELLKGIVVYGVGVDHIDVVAATEKKIYVINTPGVNSVSVAEFAFGLMINIVRKIPQLTATLRAGKWKYFGDILGNELSGKTLGIIGLGKVGSHIAVLGRAFGMKIIAHDPSPVAFAHGIEIGVSFVDLKTLLSTSDFVIVSSALTKETHGLIGETEINLLKATAYLVNVARGPIIDEQALTKALKENRIAGAALDVFEKEPPDPENPLLHLDNVIVTPHMAGTSEEAMRRLQMTVAEESARILSGSLPRYIVNRELLGIK
jgi:D-3-phosphoglycerate dehydrogenase